MPSEWSTAKSRCCLSNRPLLTNPQSAAFLPTPTRLATSRSRRAPLLAQCSMWAPAPPTKRCGGAAGWTPGCESPPPCCGAQQPTTTLAAASALPSPPPFYAGAACDNSPPKCGTPSSHSQFFNRTINHFTTLSGHPTRRRAALQIPGKCLRNLAVCAPWSPLVMGTCSKTTSTGTASGKPQRSPDAAHLQAGAGTPPRGRFRMLSQNWPLGKRRTVLLPDATISSTQTQPGRYRHTNIDTC